MTYDGILPAASVWFACGFEEVAWQSGFSIKNIHTNSLETRFGWMTKGDVTNVPRNNLLGPKGPLAHARITIEADFRPFPYLLMRRRAWRYMLSAKQADGNARGIRQDVNPVHKFW
jgi:hypothetical protein